MILYSFDLDEDCYGVRLTASCLAVPLTLRSVDMVPGREHLSPALLARNPAGHLPVLEDGPLVLTHSGAIVLHLSAMAGGALQPADLQGRARMHDWLHFAALDLAAARQARAAAMLGAPGNIDRLRAAARAALRIMDDHITRAGLWGQGFFAGQAPSLADLALFPGFALSRDYGLDHDEFPALRLWARRVRQVPGFITMPGIPDYH